MQLRLLVLCALICFDCYLCVYVLLELPSEVLRRYHWTGAHRENPPADPFSSRGDLSHRYNLLTPAAGE